MKKCGKRIWKMAGMCIASVVLLVGCGQKLSDQFEEKSVKEKAETIAESAGSGKLEETYAMFGETIQASISLEQLKKSVHGVLEPLGDYKKISGTKVGGQKDKDTGTEYAVAIVMAQFENGKAQFTISFNTQMDCIGFYVK